MPLSNPLDNKNPGYWKHSYLKIEIYRVTKSDKNIVFWNLHHWWKRNTGNKEWSTQLTNYK